MSTAASGPVEPAWETMLTDKAEARLAAGQWRELCAELRAQQKLAETNGHMILRLVMARLLWEKARADVWARGPILKAPKTGVEMHNPWLAVMNKAGATCAEIEAELTITPRKRAMGGVVKAPKPERGADNAVEL